MYASHASGRCLAATAAPSLATSSTDHPSIIPTMPPMAEVMAEKSISTYSSSTDSDMPAKWM